MILLSTKKNQKGVECLCYLEDPDAATTVSLTMIPFFGSSSCSCSFSQIAAIFWDLEATTTAAVSQENIVSHNTKRGSRWGASFCLSDVFHHYVFHTVCHMLTSITAFFKTGEHFHPSHDFNRVVMFHIQAAHRFHIQGVALFLQPIDLDD